MEDSKVRSSVQLSKGTVASEDFPLQSWLWKRTARSEMASVLGAVVYLIGQLPSGKLAFKSHSRSCRRPSITPCLCTPTTSTCSRSCLPNVYDSWRCHDARRACHSNQAKKHSGTCSLAVSIVIRRPKSISRFSFWALPDKKFVISQLLFSVMTFEQSDYINIH